MLTMWWIVIGISVESSTLEQYDFRISEKKVYGIDKTKIAYSSQYCFQVDAEIVLYSTGMKF